MLGFINVSCLQKFLFKTCNFLDLTKLVKDNADKYFFSCMSAGNHELYSSLPLWLLGEMSSDMLNLVISRSRLGELAKKIHFDKTCSKSYCFAMEQVGLFFELYHPSIKDSTF